MANVFAPAKDNAAHNATCAAFVNACVADRHRGSAFGERSARIVIRIAEMIESGDSDKVPAMLANLAASR